MRLTPRRLRAWVEHYVAEKRRDLNLLAMYLTGSLLGDEPLFGGITDLDVVCLYNLAPEQTVEVRPLPGGVHLDVRHWPREQVEPPRKLRLDPWLGHEIYYAQPLYDPQHFLDFVQSGARSRFHHPEVAARRAWNLLEQARSAWANLLQAEPLTPAQVQSFLETVYTAMHIPATLHGRVLPWRRAAVLWRQEAAAAGHPEWVAGWLQVLAAPGVTVEALRAALTPWAAAWQAARTAAPQDPAFHPAREQYYRAGLTALLAQEPPTQALLLLLATWSWALRAAGADAAPRAEWEATLQAWGWEDADARLTALDQWLDALEAYLEQWMQAQGVRL